MMKIRLRKNKKNIDKLWDILPAFAFAAACVICCRKLISTVMILYSICILFRALKKFINAYSQN